jgi:hypothetical protein
MLCSPLGASYFSIFQNCCGEPMGLPPSLQQHEHRYSVAGQVEARKEGPPKKRIWVADVTKQRDKGLHGATCRGLEGLAGAPCSPMN